MQLALRDKSEQATKLEKHLEERFKKDLKKEKEAWLASERVRQEKWKEEHAETVKQNTFKSVKPHIEKIIEGNKEELRKQADRHQAELKRAKELMQEEWEKRVEQAREKALKEKEEGLEKERVKS